ncbi:hypothetical protein [Pseudonocardia sp. H11422]|uniref:hypothetical protein n=1 Tax=Pseudonocardia sp. H11422 TaxID=2835866 RepID=UPI001BDC2F5B|nr:hypothetical protein [Pseudonocardia sp. H11422]
MVLSAYLAGPAGPAQLAVIDRYEPLPATGPGVVEYCSDELVKADEMIDTMRTTSRSARLWQGLADQGA